MNFSEQLDKFVERGAHKDEILKQKFFKHENKSKGCWIWKGSITGKGYGRIRHKGRRLMAHRVSWEIYNNSAAPEHLSICHSCDVPLCVNPDHLRPCTQSENMQEAHDRGRIKQFRGFRVKACHNGHKYTSKNIIIRKNKKNGREYNSRRCLICTKATKLFQRKEYRMKYKSYKSLIPMAIKMLEGGSK